MRVFLAGEGKTELGRYALSKEYVKVDHEGGPSVRSKKHTPTNDEVGVLEAIVRRHCRDLEIVGAELWKTKGTKKKVPKLKVGRGMSGAEMQTVRGLALRAEKDKAQVLVFTRDRDGDKARERDVEAGLAEARRENPSLRIVGGVATEMIECWLLALLGDYRSQTCHDPKGELAKRHQVTSVQQMVDRVRSARLDEGAVPADAESLRTWLQQAREALGPPMSPSQVAGG